MRDPKKKKKLDNICNLLARMAKITGIKFQRIEKDGEDEVAFSIPINSKILSILFASLPAALVEEAIDDSKKKTPPPNDTFEGKKRF